MSRTQFYTATSLDGFIATPENSLDWLLTRQQDRAGPMNYAEFIAGVGALAMGSTTYEWILAHEFGGEDLADGKWPYRQPCWVFTHRDLPVVPGADIRFVRDDVVPVHAAMVDGRRRAGTCGSSAAATWPASSPTTACSTTCW